MTRLESPPQRWIGLTGGIATGKTTVANYLATHHQLPILDADDYAREAVALGSGILARIVDRYGSEILCADGQLHRQRLGAIVFNHATERQWLEQQIHPFVRHRLVQERQAFPAAQFPCLVLVIPLLFEAQMMDLVTEIWVVFCTPAQQLERLCHRNQLTPAQAQARIHSQWPLTEKIARAHVVLDNSTRLGRLYHQIDIAVASQQ
ncbi:dephospho-CoA kinase [Neosynechococcus sphagnicola sy1]|uniref:Dephospho-CoA kinase n=1 Tax=Neosynechococcus sphagnicola sy1 TaxID=1497020 RepID=A0A098TLT6_9CYAN|nr:dephospho-CoA kinase [Neosynechococcus sphagnicola]KGF73221.1 dephospho-CoA kinase [Neosynechococcus sphagnicola sy1]